MPVHFRCPCGVVLSAPDGGPGKGGECPTCGKVVVVPANALDVGEAELGAPSAAAPAAAPLESPAPVATPAPVPEQVLAPGPELELAPAPGPAPTQTPAPQPAATPVPRPATTPVPAKRATTPVPKRPSVTPVPVPVPAAPAPMEVAASAGDVQLAPLPEGLPEAVADEDMLTDDDILPDDSIEVVADDEQAVAVPESLNALDGLGMAETEPLEDAGEGEEPGMATDREARRATGRASRRTGGRTGRTRRPRKCPECSSENEPGMRECANCGAQLRGAAPKKGGGLKKVLIALVLLLLLGAGGIAAAGYFVRDKLPEGLQNILKSIGLPQKQAPAATPEPAEGDGEAEKPKEEAPAPAERAPEGDVLDMGDDVTDAPSAREDSAIGLGAGGIATPDATPDLGGGGPAAPTVSTGGDSGIDE